MGILNKLKKTINNIRLRFCQSLSKTPTLSKTPNILDGSAGNSRLDTYYKTQISDSFSLISKDASFRYEFFGEQIQKTRCLGDIKSLLCVGCRNAHELNYFESLGISGVVGIDLLSVDPRILIMDMQKMSFNDSMFDALYSGDSFEHAMDLYQAANEFVRVVKPGGFIILSVPANTRVDEVDRWTFTDFASVYKYFGSSVGKVLLEDVVPDDEGRARTLRIIFQTSGK